MGLGMPVYLKVSRELNQVASSVLKATGMSLKSIHYGGSGNWEVSPVFLQRSPFEKELVAPILSLSPFFPQFYLRRINKFSRTRDRNEKMDSTSVPTTGFYTKLSNLAVLILVLLSCSTFTCTGQCLMFLFYFANICSQKTDCSPLLPVVGFGGIRVSHFFGTFSHSRGLSIQTWGNEVFFFFHSFFSIYRLKSSHCSFVRCLTVAQ